MNMPFLKNITLCGVKHAGKTTAANALAKLTGLPFADSDDALQVGRLSLNKVIHSAAVKKGFLKDMPLSRFHRRKVKYVNHR